MNASYGVLLLLLLLVRGVLVFSLLLESWNSLEDGDLDSEGRAIEAGTSSMLLLLPDLAGVLLRRGDEWSIVASAVAQAWSGQKRGRRRAMGEIHSEQASMEELAEWDKRAQRNNLLHFNTLYTHSQPSSATSTRPRKGGHRDWISAPWSFLRYGQQASLLFPDYRHLDSESSIPT